MKIKMIAIQRTLIAGILLGAFLCAGVYFPVISFSPAFMILLLINGIVLVASWFMHKGKILYEPKLRKVVHAIVILVVASLVALLINGYGINDGFILILLSFFLGVSVYETINCSDDIDFYLSFYVVISAVSALVQIGQVLQISFFYDIWRIVQQGDALDHFANVNRYLGLSSNLVNFSLQMSVAYTIVLTTKYKNRIWKLLKYPLIVLFAVSVWLSETRSGMIAILFVLVVAFLQFTKNKRNRLQKIVLIISAMVGIGITYEYFIALVSNSRLYTAASTRGTLARLPMFLTALNHALHYPLGMGVYSVKPEYIIDSGGFYIQVMNNSAHNLLANCAASYGWIALIALVILYIEVFKAYNASKDIEDNRLSGQINTAMLCVIALLISSLTHNKYLLNGDFSAHLFIAIVFSIYKINRENERDASYRQNNVKAL